MNNESMNGGIPDYIGRIRFKPVETNPDRVYRHILYRLGHEMPQDKRGVSPAWKYISIAALLAWMIVVLYAFALGKDEKTTPTPPPVVYMEVSAIPGTKTSIVLPDSSTVWLNSSATLRYPQQFAGNRMVELKGE